MTVSVRGIAASNRGFLCVMQSILKNVTQNVTQNALKNFILRVSGVADPHVQKTLILQGFQSVLVAFNYH